MIKCSGFGKLLKQFFIISLISCFGLLGSSFVNAGTVQTVGLQDSPSIYNNQYDITFLKGGAFKSMFLGQAKSVLALNSNLLFFRTIEGKLYYFNDGEQGYFGEYRSCDEITGLNYDISNANCSSLNFGLEFHSVFKNFFSNVKAGDYVYYNVEGGIHNTFRDRKVNICFSNSVLHKSICFLYAYCNSSQGICNGGYGDLAGRNYGTLTGSLNLTGSTTFADISQSLLGYAPGQFGYDGGFDNGSGSFDLGGSSDFNNNNFSGDYTYVNCTYGSIIDYLEKQGCNKNLCYGGIDNFNLYNSSTNYNIIPGTGKTLSQILAHSSTSAWSTPQEWFNYWNGIYGGFNDVWSSYPAVYHTWFDIYNQYGNGNVYFDDLREYCVMTVDLNIDRNGLYKGNQFKKVCRDIQNRDIGVYDSSGNVIVSVNWDGFAGYSGNNIKTPLQYVQDYFDKLKSNFPTRYDFGLGFLPIWIATFLCAIVLFRFISH